MKKFIAILFLFLLCLQAVPLVQFVVDEDLNYSWVDEDKPDEGKVKDKKLCAEFITVTPPAAEQPVALVHGTAPQLLSLPAPYLAKFSPPPNHV